MSEPLSTKWLDCLASSRDRLVLLARSPKSIFIYWEWLPAKTALFEKGALNREVVLKLFDAGSRIPAAEFRASWNTLKMYVQPPSSGKSYYAALYVSTAAGAPQSVLDSNTVWVPRGIPSGAVGPLPYSEERMRS